MKSPGDFLSWPRLPTATIKSHIGFWFILGGLNPKKDNSQALQLGQTCFCIYDCDAQFPRSSCMWYSWVGQVIEIGGSVSWWFSCPLHCGGSIFVPFGFGLSLGLFIGLLIGLLLGVYLLSSQSPDHPLWTFVRPSFSRRRAPPSPSEQPLVRSTRLSGYLHE